MIEIRGVPTPGGENPHRWAWQTRLGGIGSDMVVNPTPGAIPRPGDAWMARGGADRGAAYSGRALRPGSERPGAPTLAVPALRSGCARGGRLRWDKNENPWWPSR
jgi:hypothetical protein